MKAYLSIFIMVLFCSTSWSQTAVGTWKTIDDEDGKAKSNIEIYEKDGKLYGKIIKLIDPERTICTKCKGDKKDKPIEGMVIVWDLEQKSGTEWDGGKILDPKNGKEYKCLIELKDANTLKVRGFIGVSLFGRTQYWYRVES